MIILSKRAGGWRERSAGVKVKVNYVALSQIFPSQDNRWVWWLGFLGGCYGKLIENTHEYTPAHTHGLVKCNVISAALNLKHSA